MAILTGAEFQDRFRLPRLMTLTALDRGMFPFERVFGFAVIKIGGTDTEPTLSGMTGVAVYAQSALVSVSMAAGALGVVDSSVLGESGVGKRWIIRYQLMALGARHGDMFAGQGIFG